MALLIGAALERDFHAFELLDHRLLLGALLTLHPLDFLAAGFDLFHVAGSGLDGQVLRQKGDIQRAAAILAEGARAKQKKEADLGRMLQKKP